MFGASSKNFGKVKVLYEFEMLDIHAVHVGSAWEEHWDGAFDALQSIRDRLS